MPYRERVHWPGWFLVALGLALVGGYAALAGSAATPPWALGLGALPFLAAAYATWRLRFVALECAPEGMGFGFGGITRRVPRERILGADVIDYPVARYMGWGYRLGWEPRERAYSVLGCRRGVLLRFEDERGRPWKIFVSSRTPEAAVAALRA